MLIAILAGTLGLVPRNLIEIGSPRGLQDREGHILSALFACIAAWYWLDRRIGVFRRSHCGVCVLAATRPRCVFGVLRCPPRTCRNQHIRTYFNGLIGSRLGRHREITERMGGWTETGPCSG